QLSPWQSTGFNRIEEIRKLGQDGRGRPNWPCPAATKPSIAFPLPDRQRVDRPGAGGGGGGVAADGAANDAGGSAGAGEVGVDGERVVELARLMRRGDSDGNEVHLLGNFGRDFQLHGFVVGGDR